MATYPPTPAAGAAADHISLLPIGHIRAESHAPLPVVQQWVALEGQTVAQVEAKLLVLLEPWQGTIDFKLQGFSVEKDSAASILAVGRDPVLTITATSLDSSFASAEVHQGTRTERKSFSRSPWFLVVMIVGPVFGIILLFTLMALATG